MTVSNIEIQYSNLIKELRFNNRLDEAILLCEKAIAEFPKNNFFYKVKGDMCFEKNDYKPAALSYLKFLQLIGDNEYLIRNFARFYTRFNKIANSDENQWYNSLILNSIQRGEVSEKIITTLVNIEFADVNLRDFIDLCNDNKNESKISAILKDDNENICLFAVLAEKTNTEINDRCNMIDQYLISVAEKTGDKVLISLAIKLSRRMIRHYGVKNPTLIRTLFRLCRKRDDYKDIESLIDINSNFVVKSDFNIQYELVYYFERQNNRDLLLLTLKCMKNSAERSIPIARTLYNFYLRFGLMDEAKGMSDHIAQLIDAKRENSYPNRIEEQIESEKGVWTKIRELVTDQEHNRQMLALRDLLKGFSHELGQPVTNIRYSIQLYQMEIEKGRKGEDRINEIFTSILKQTDRIHALLSRFRPIVSSKSTVETFNVYDRVVEVFYNLSERLEKSDIEYVCDGDRDFDITGDPVQFDQIFYNLILNSMQAISTNPDSNIKDKGMIKVNFKIKKNKLTITVCDNGSGILVDDRRKIFEPFFTTKESSDKGEGGEGLGLFIVWNVLKMFNGTICLDDRYTNGAKFIIEL